MSKKTLKGIALGASVALAAAGFGVAPANAAETLALAPSAGTSYKVLTTSTFKLAAAFAGTESTGAQAALKFRVTNASNGSLSFTQVAAGNGTVTETSVDYGTTTAAAATGADVVVAGNVSPAIGSENSLEIALASNDKDYNVTVQAWIDLDGGNDIDANEQTSPVRTINFVDQANVTGDAVLVSPVVGGSTLKATASLNGGFNYDQLDADDIKIEFFKDNVSLASTDDTAAAASGTGFTANGAVTAAQRTNPNTAAWSSTDSEIAATLYPESADANAADTVYALLANVSTSTYGAKLRVYDGTNWTVTGSGAFASPTAGVATALSAVTAKKGTSFKTTGALVRSGAGSITVYTDVTVPATSAKSGHVVTFTITEDGNSDLAGGASVTAGGKTLTNSAIGSAQSITATATTDADGRASLTIAYAGFEAGNGFDVDAKITGATAVVTGAQLANVTAADSLATAIEDNIVYGKKTVVKGGTVALDYSIVDQFGQVPSGTFRAVIAETSGDANFATTIAFSAGKASLSVADNSAAAGTYDVTATLQKQATDGSWAAANALVATSNINVIAAAQSTSTVTVAAGNDGATTAIVRDLLDAYTGNSNLVQESATVPAYANGTTLTVTATAANGALLVGETVSVSAAGLTFKVDGHHYSVGSATATTNASGQVVFNVYSNLAGKKTVSVTVGSVAKTQDLTFAAAANTTGATLTVSAPATAKAGRTVVVTGQLVDEYGNAVKVAQASPVVAGDPDFEVTYEGPGFVVGTLPTATDASGKFVVRVLLGSDDSGVGTITAKYDQNGDADYADADDLTSSKTILFGVSATVAAAKKAASATVKNAAGLTVKVVSGTKSVTKVATSDSYKVSLTKLTAGKKTVKVYVEGILVLSKSVTVKK